eukprot:scaffold2230_cov187-Amphora_coffeaeformis.AAC.13
MEKSRTRGSCDRLAGGRAGLGRPDQQGPLFVDVGHPILRQNDTGRWVVGSNRRLVVVDK